MTNRQKIIIGAGMAVAFIVGVLSGKVITPRITVLADTQTCDVCVIFTPTATEPPTATDTLSPTDTPTPAPTDTPAPTNTPTLGPTVAPFQAAPLCTGHSTTVFHTLWDSSRGCHYDHEHGTNPFTPEVATAFPGFDLFALLGNVGVGHTNLSSPMENTMKHGGFKWDVVLGVPCGPFEDAQFCVTDAAVQYHNFGDYALEMETRHHTTTALVKVCNPAEVSDCGYLYTVQLQEYGQRTTPYQGTVMPYPDSPVPQYAGGFGPYFTIDPYGTCVGCRPSLDFVRNLNANANSIWTSKPTGILGNPPRERPQTSNLFRLLFRIRDNYQLVEWASVLDGYPFHFGFVCGGDVYNPAGCRYNNSTSKVHEVAGNIPASWDNLEGFDTDARVGRITAEGYTSQYGDIALDCLAPGGNCYPVKLVGMFVGNYGGALPGAKVSTTSPISNPERDLYFCGLAVCAEGAPGAVPSGWIGPSN